MLHIVNGDSVADKLKQAEVPGDILVWREVYPAGPVFSSMSEGSSRLARAQYLERALGVPQMEYLQSSENQERACKGSAITKKLYYGSSMICSIRR